MSYKRIIPCLDIKDGRVVKGTNFVDLKDAGDPVELAVFYAEEEADELIFLNISGTVDGQKAILALVADVSKKISIPITVGGGISKLEDMESLLAAGASKVSISTAAIKDPDLIARGAEKFGSQSIVVAIDAKAKEPQGEGEHALVFHWEVYTNGGKRPTGIDASEWAKKVEELGAGEILLTSIDADGTRSGYDNVLNRTIAESVDIPVIASGGAGNPEDMRQAIVEGKVSAVLGASIFHQRRYSIREVKSYLNAYGIPVKLSI